MRIKPTFLAVLTTVAVTASVVARAETAVESFDRGERLLAKGEFESAMESFAAAARADRANQEYMQHYAILRRIVELRRQLTVEKQAERWQYVAMALRTFYASERVYPELLKLDLQIHQRLNSAESTAMLAETQLALNQNASAVETLSALESNKATTTTRLLLGIAFARTGKSDQARKIAEEVQVPKDTEPSVAYTAARLYAAAGDSANATALLTTCFERTPPSLLDGYKSHAQTCPDFAAIAPSGEFVKTLKTESKVPESKCSGGSSCAGCPMRGKCPMSQGR